jgi:hypothetical protein
MWLRQLCRNALPLALPATEATALDRSTELVSRAAAAAVNSGESAPATYAVSTAMPAR